MATVGERCARAGDDTELVERRYCMRVEAFTGSRIEEVKCWTRQEWAEQGVDLDKDWPKEGIRIIAG